MERDTEGAGSLEQNAAGMAEMESASSQEVEPLSDAALDTAAAIISEYEVRTMAFARSQAIARLAVELSAHRDWNPMGHLDEAAQLLDAAARY